MLKKIGKIIFGSKYERDIKRLKPLVSSINSLESKYQNFSDEDLRKCTFDFKERISKGESLDFILSEAFAVVREASIRKMGMRHFNVQIMGGVALHQGKIAEMKTGEGKTLTSTLPIYLNTLNGKGVHVVTVNDYLAQRDANWMRPIFEFLGLSVGFIQNNMEHKKRQEAYSKDITYGTNNEFGFDYLRDNMVSCLEHRVQRGHSFAIVDEVDSVLIDEARTPLIISGPSDDFIDNYIKVDKFITQLLPNEHFEIDEKVKNALLNEKGIAKIEQLLEIENLYQPENLSLVHNIHQAIKAHHLFQKDVDYVVQKGEVIIVDEFTGRLMKGRRYSDGLHQAIEAKEKVKIAQESQSLASITFQNYFRLYKKLSGMTGTADTEAEEFKKIYNLEVNVIPTNLPNQRKDHPDKVYKTEAGKFKAIVNEIKGCYQRNQPVLVGTISIEKSEKISNILKQNKIPHNVLNAKFHTKEAQIIAEAGKPGSITIATNMAGRGTDIVLGGSPEYKKMLEDWIRENSEKQSVIDEFYQTILNLDIEEAGSIIENFEDIKSRKIADDIWNETKKWINNHNIVLKAGGLHILGTERHESRRIDNQLRGRSGRQGDKGSSRFYLSLEDDLMRIFGSDKIAKIMEKLNMPEDQEIEHTMVSNAIARSQKKVESHNFDMRKNLLEYDDVMNQQRNVIYELRTKALENDTITKHIKEYLEEVIENQILRHCDSNHLNSWNLKELQEFIENLNISNLKLDIEKYKSSKDPQLELFDDITEKATQSYETKKRKINIEVWDTIEKNIFLDILDHRWKEHLFAMDTLRDGIWTAGYSEKDPLIEYKLKGFKVFEKFLQNLKFEIITFLFKLELTQKIEEKILNTEQEEYQEIGEINLSENQNKKNKVIITSGGSERKSRRRKKRR